MPVPDDDVLADNSSKLASSHSTTITIMTRHQNF
jgi:hypothetical protein